MISQKVGVSIFVRCNKLNLQALKFDFCAFCAFLRLYQLLALVKNQKGINSAAADKI
jgi:hypothetical protein